MEKLRKLLNSALALPLRLLKAVVEILYKVLKSILTSPLFLMLLFVVGGGFGFAIGARMFETGWAQNLGVDLKGQNVKLSGPCRVDGEIRKPALAEDEVKIVSVEKNKITGIIRATRETVECDAETTAIDRLPLLHDLANSPVQIPEIKVSEVNHADNEVAELKKRTIRASGTCELKDGAQTDSFMDQDIEVISAERSETDKTIINISGIMKNSKSAVKCNTRNIRYNILDGATVVVKGSAPAVLDNKNIVGELILITSNCFPDHRLPPSKRNKTIYYPLIDARMKVVEATFNDVGALAYVAGAVIENGALVECDTSRYPISWKPYDDRIKLTPIKGGVETTTEEQVERARPQESDATEPAARK
jgi:hypothetical protein